MASESAWDDDAVEQIALARILATRQPAMLPTPAVQEVELPLRALAPEVFERVVAEFAWLVEGLRAVHLYGRRGQGQYGLDVVGTNADGSSVVYQAKRFETISAKQIRTAVEVYAGTPDEHTGVLPKRRFDADRFALVTSAQIEGDTALTDSVIALQQHYRKHGLVVDIIGAEHLSRALRDASGLVHAIFGPEWARAFCGVTPPQQPAGTPSPYGLLEDPLEECGLAGAPDRAQQIAVTSPQRGAELLASVADVLRSEGYTGHADTYAHRAAVMLLNAGHAAEAFDIVWPIAVERLLGGNVHDPGDMRDWRERLTDDPVRTARTLALDALRDWHGGGHDLGQLVDALDVLRAAEDANFGIFTCIALEQTLTDGLFTTSPPTSWISTELPDDAEALLDRLLLHGQHAGTVTPDRTWRCRIRCAIADATIDRQRQHDTEVDVTALYRAIVTDAGAGRLPQHAAAIAHARCARAYAVAGRAAEAVDEWRRSFMASLQAGHGGDARSALHSLEQTAPTTHDLDFGRVSDINAGIPNSTSFLEGRSDAYYGAIEDLQAGHLQTAIRSVRRSLFEERAGGYIVGVRRSQRLFSDILDKAARPTLAVVAAIVGGDGKVAASRAEAVEEWIDVLSIIRSGPPWAAAAAIRVLAQQHDLIPDDRVGETLDLLIEIATTFWQPNSAGLGPAESALDALVPFAFRADEPHVEPLLELAQPALSANTRKTKQAALIAGRVVVRYSRYTDRVLNLFARALALPYVDDDLWNIIRKLPEVLAPLTDDIRRHAAADDGLAVRTLVAWGVATIETRRSARRYAYRILSKPLTTATNSVGISELNDHAARLLKALVLDGNGDDGPLNLDATELHDAPVMSSNERAALTAIVDGDVHQLADAVVTKLLALAGNRHETGQARAEAVRGVSLLREIIDPATALQIASTFVDLAVETEQHPLDALAFSTDPLASFRWSNPPETLPAAAVDAAAEMYAVHVSASHDATLPNRIVAAAEPLLRSSRDHDCISAAWAIATVADSDAAMVQLASHRLADVRSLTMNVWERSTTRPLALAVHLARDPSAKVRASVARRYNDLAADPASRFIVGLLTVDRSHQIRQMIERRNTAAS
ncbi:hypothetical protein AB0K00_33140 [Dactylosporangium sp. NPDC049525]|uniref:hypothetical protein n=1 Tax=Dactylosporangium sp. NPDC049525 TaxID=3154730 RepID=UPI00343E0772